MGAPQQHALCGETTGMLGNLRERRVIGTARARRGAVLPPPLVPYGCIMFSVRLSSPIADRADSMKARVANDDFG